jgi:SAM-dependent methyltransferase
MVCHGELYRLKPHPRLLTGYYLMIAAGGALGGFFVAVLAPLIFDTYVELHWGLGLCLFLFLIVCASNKGALGPGSWRVFGLLYVLLACAGLDRAVAWSASWLKTNHEKLRWNPFGALNWEGVENLHWVVWIGVVTLAVRAIVKRDSIRSRDWHLMSCALVAIALFSVSATLWIQSWQDERGALSVVRNFYGVLTVMEYDKESPENHYLLLRHGHITHGLQFVDSASAAWPTSYYGETSGIGRAMRHYPRQQDRAIGIVGLGTGTLAAYGRKGDRLRFYEINPEVKRLAQDRFTYLKKCPARVEVVLGDARLSLEREPPQAFDLLALDAFSSDAIPTHLLTREAFATYLRHMKPEGIIAVHISNYYLNLRPVVDSLAAHFKLQSVSIDHDEDDESEWWHYASTWMLLTRNQEFVQLSAIREAQTQPDKHAPSIQLWTDDYTALFPILE